MILINKHKYENCNNFLDKYFSGKIFTETDEIFIVEENNKKLGYIIISRKENLVYLKELFIVEGFRNMSFGDGLLRAALNSLRLKGIKKVRYMNSCDYLIKKGFYEKENYLECDIDIFFLQHSCKR